MPDIGTVRYLKTPVPSPTVRVETGIREGDEVSIHYDPMIAKLVVWDHDRTSSLRKLRNALDEFRVVGLKTNIQFLRDLSAHPSFIKAEVETGFIPVQKHSASW